MLRLEEVRARFYDQLVLRDVTMTVASSRTTVLIGRNGAGKTTTLRCIMGLLPLEGAAYYSTISIWLRCQSMTVPASASAMRRRIVG
jgi:ABC-type branched-subunit amino acid transport system ATPase component